MATTSPCNGFIRIILILGLATIIGCGSSGGGDDGNSGGGGSQYSLALGDWSGDDLSFTVTSGSYYVNDLSVTYRGHADGNICNYDYENGTTLGFRIPVTNNTFSYESSGLTISGEFMSTTSVEVDISWSTYNSQCDATESGEALLTASPGAVVDDIALDGGYIQYRTNADGTYVYKGWIEFSKNGDPGHLFDIDDIQLKDSSGDTVPLSKYTYYKESPYIGDWNDNTSKVEFEDPSTYSGFSIQFPPETILSQDTYTYEVFTADGELLTMAINFPGAVDMPVVDSASMAVEELLNGDDKFTWNAPVGDYDEYRLTFVDQNYVPLLYVTLPANAEEFTVPKMIGDKIDNEYKPTKVHWEIQTRAYNNDRSNNYARGYSGVLDITNIN